jgi:hypothetical protein
VLDSQPVSALWQESSLLQCSGGKATCFGTLVGASLLAKGVTVYCDV